MDATVSASTTIGVKSQSPRMSAKKSYIQLATEAIKSIADRTGSSAQAIKGYITTNYPAVKFAPHLLRAALKRGVESGKLVKVKSSFKLSSAAPKAKKPSAKAPKKSVAEKAPQPAVVF